MRFHFLRTFDRRTDNSEMDRSFAHTTELSRIEVDDMDLGLRTRFERHGSLFLFLREVKCMHHVDNGSDFT